MNFVLSFNSHLTIIKETKLMSTHNLRAFSASSQIRNFACGRIVKLGKTVQFLSMKESRDSTPKTTKPNLIDGYAKY
uniref:Uncharacterized protein n=1 Tax=Oryza brachyantha TaxID=4533 RepID=J3MGV7_ORYBR